MILSTSSSRAVSIRIGTSESWRMRLQTSMPSMSGSIRSSTTSAGSCASACRERVGSGRGGSHRRSRRSSGRARRRTRSSSRPRPPGCSRLVSSRYGFVRCRRLGAERDMCDAVGCRASGTAASCPSRARSCRGRPPSSRPCSVATPTPTAVRSMPAPLKREPIPAAGHAKVDVGALVRDEPWRGVGCRGRHLRVAAADASRCRRSGRSDRRP